MKRERKREKQGEKASEQAHMCVPQPDHTPCCLWRFGQPEAGIHLKERQDLEKEEKGTVGKMEGQDGWTSCLMQIPENKIKLVKY